MKPRLATADYSFPLLNWQHSLHLASDLGFNGIDLSLFEGRSQLKPAEILARPSESGREVRDAVASNGLIIADVFGIPGINFADFCPNHPEAAVRGKSREYFKRILDFTRCCGGGHLSLLPGITFPDEDVESSFSRCADELGWRCEQAEEVGVRFSVEAHKGSIIEKPQLARRLLDYVPALTLTLDLGHFISQGIPQAESDPLLSRTAHVHARCACPGRLQTSLKNNAIDFPDLMKKLKAQGYDGWYTVEYVWIDWEHCNEVDNLSESILLRDLLQSIGETIA